MLKKIICLTNLLWLIVPFANGQENATQEKGGFGSPVMQYTMLGDQWTFEAGGIGAGYITQNLYAGGGGFASSTTSNNTTSTLAYGGVLMGYDFSKKEQRIGLNTYVLAGYGAISNTEDTADEQKDDVWIIKPTIELEIRILSWMKFGIGGGYKIATGSNIESLSNNDLSSPFASISFRMGVF